MSEKTWFMFRNVTADSVEGHLYIEAETVLDAYDLAEGDPHIELQPWHYCSDCCENWYIEPPPPDAMEIRPGVRLARRN